MLTGLLQDPRLILLVSLLPDFPQTGPMFLVGGAIRDVFLGRSPTDFDFTCEYDPTPLARAFANRCGGHWFWLDERRRQSRIVIANGTFDFAPWRASTLAGDLAGRDFTINAMAVDLAAPDTLIDPLGGQADLATRRLHCAGPNVLRDDPVRLLKGLRHSVELGLTVEQATLDAMRVAAPLLPACAAERLRLEFWRILAAPNGERGLALLHECAAAAILFGSGDSAGLQVRQQALRRANTLYAALAEQRPGVAGWLREPVEQGLDRATLLRWCRVLGANHPEHPLLLAHRWRFSRNALARIAALCALTPRQWPELTTVPVRPRPVALWALQHGPDPLDLLLMLGLLAEDEPSAVCTWLLSRLDAVAALPDMRQIAPLADGNWLRQELGLEGPMLGTALAELRRAEVAGQVGNADEARRYLAGHYPKRC